MRRCTWWAAALLTSLAATPLGAQQIEGEVTAIGFPFGQLTRNAIRVGQWFPIRVELRAVSGDEVGVEVDLRVQSSDTDGDRVEFTKPGVTLTVGDIQRPVWCYAVAYYGGAGAFDAPRGPETLTVVDVRRNQTLGTLALPTVDVVDNESMLVLDVSARKISKLDSAIGDALDTNDVGWGQRRFYRKTFVGAGEAAALPDCWFGLEMIDVVVWDAPDPAGQQVGESQVEALAEWVRNGGQLVLGLGGNVDALADTALAELMPYELLGGSRSTETLEQFSAAYVPSRAPLDRFETPLPVAKVKMRAGATRLVWDTVGGYPQPVLAVWCVGSGRVIAAAPSLRDLVNLGVKPDFYHVLFDLYENTPAFQESEASQLMTGLLQRPLYDGLVQPVGFALAGQVNAIIAMLFVCAYVGLSTVASFLWLRSKRKSSLAWPVFAGVAVAASFLSLGAVYLGRGVVSSVRTASLVDLEAGSQRARARCWIGYRSPRRELLDLALPPAASESRGTCFLRPIASKDASGHFATPLRYGVDTDHAALRDAPLRGTLKQFEGFWQGDGGGTVRVRLIADRATGRITNASWIANSLGVDIERGYLIYFDPRQREATRPSGVDRFWWAAMKAPVPPPRNVLAVELPSIADGDDLRGVIGAAAYRDNDQRLARWRGVAGAADRPETRPDLPTLLEAQLGWVPFTRNLNFEEAAMMASTRNLYLHCSALDRPDVAGRPVTTAGVPKCDVTHWLMDGQALLLLVADTPGPATLTRSGDARSSDAGRTLYRVRAPLEYVGAARATPEIGE